MGSSPSVFTGFWPVESTQLHQPTFTENVIKLFANTAFDCALRVGILYGLFCVFFSLFFPFFSLFFGGV
jgi:hypothetical protein